MAFRGFPTQRKKHNGGNSMDNKKVKTGALIALGVLLAIICLQIILKLFRAGTKVGESVTQVSTVLAQAKEISETVVIQGIAEGDPQVKIYPAVSGKFERVQAPEGSLVKKNDVILYINRDIVGMDFQLVPVKSPVDGIVTRIYYSDKGASVTPQNPVAEVANPGNIKVILNTGEEDMVKVKNNMEASVKPVYSSGEAIQATVYSSTPFIDKDTLSGTIIVKGKNIDNVIKPGMSVEVTVYTAKRNALMLPENAILMGDGKTYVYINENNRAKRVDIEPGYMTTDEVEVKSGLTENAMVIVEGNFKLSEGMKVSVK
jgi:multidrug efflux pump subunit AcrA (membrane-fusion protein)